MRITIDATCNAAYAGEPGDGKIFNCDLGNMARIHTREIGITAL